MKKTLRVPLTADGVPIATGPQSLDKTRELPVCDTPADAIPPLPAQGAPEEVVDDEVTVPVQSSIESTLTYELLRRQSKEAGEDEE